MSDKKILSLWGMPGAGKTYWAKIIAEELSIQFIDLDHYLEESTQMKISDMVIKEGEPYFREKEKEALQKLLRSKSPLVLSLGGGTPCNESNLDLLKANCLNIWLNTEIAEIIQNLGKEAGKRPLIDPKSDLENQMKELLDRRMKYYKRADLIIDQPLNIQSILKAIPESFKKTIRRL